MDVLAPHLLPPATSSSVPPSPGVGTSYGCNTSNISRAASMAALSPRWSDRKKSVGNIRYPSRSGATPVSHLSRSASCLAQKQQQQGKSKTPITEQVMKLASKMEDSKVRDLAYLVEDAKLLHQKLTALETEGVDLTKVGLFSEETLASFTPPPTPVTKRPRGRAYENIPNTKKNRARRASTTSASSGRIAAQNSRKALSMPRGSIASLSSTVSEGTKSKKRNIFASFGRAKGKRSSEELSRSYNEPRHSVSSLALHHTDSKAPEKTGSKATSLSQDSPMNRSSSLDVLSFDSIPSANSVPGLSLSQTNSSSSHRSTTISGYRQASRDSKTLPSSGGGNTHMPHASSTLALRHSSHSFKSSRARKKSVDGILDSSDDHLQLSNRGSLAVSDYGSYLTTPSATPPLRQRGSKPISRHNSADRILRDTDDSIRQRFSGGGAGSPMSSQSTIGSQENFLNDTWSNPSTPSSPPSPLSQGPSLKSLHGSQEVDFEQKRMTRSATCSPGLDKSGSHGNNSVGQHNKLRKISVGSALGSTPSHHNITKSNGMAGKGLGGSSSLPPTPGHISKSLEPRTFSRDTSSLSSQLNSLSSQQDSAPRNSASGSSLELGEG